MTIQEKVITLLISTNLTYVEIADKSNTTRNRVATIASKTKLVWSKDRANAIVEYNFASDNEHREVVMRRYLNRI